ncbi:P-loop NTPase fold protein [Pseudomonas sp. NPDC089534]|uniref:P-loop NTPase fold protein n=1 Tax=Pseudomonas sp. NPDC089534 TaxID=3364468 RepID=UPI00381E3AA5
MVQRNETQPNGQIIDYLKYYVELEAPRYAVLLNGPWGSGKTHLIQSFLDNHFSSPPSRSRSIAKRILKYLITPGMNRYFNDKAQERSASNYIYISLYGLKSDEDISARIIASAIPGLGLKSSKILGGIIKPFLSTLQYAKLIPDLSARDFISKFHKKTYIFDDIERCEIPIKQLLGYINQFIEHGERNVILVANTDEIPDTKDFTTTQEKLVGKTFRIEPPIEEAVENFLKQLNNSPAMKLIQDNPETFSSLFRQSESKNLRVLQQALRDIERPLNALNREQFENIEGVLFLAKLIFTFSLEVRSRRMTPAILEARPQQMTELFKKFGEKNEQEKDFCKIESSYTDIDLRDPILSNDTLADIIFHGIVNAEHIQKSVTQSHFFREAQDERALDKLMYVYDLDETEFKQVRAQFESEYQNHEFRTPEDIFLSFSRRRWLSENKLLNVSLEKVSEQGDQYLEHLYETGQFPIVERDRFEGRDYAEFNGKYFDFSFKSRPLEPKHFLDTFLSLNEKARQDLYPSIVESMMAEMTDAPETFCHRISRKSFDTPSHINAEILLEMDPEAFSKRLLELHPAKQRPVLNALSSRYTFTNYSAELSGEKEWLKKLTLHLERTAKSASVFERNRIRSNIERYLKPHIGYY